MENLQSCTKLTELLKAEKSIIKRHVKEHKWYRKIPDETIGVIDFIKEFGWLMREMYCDNVCPERETCQVYKKILEKYPNDEKS
jgi:hypothetical protein